MNSNTFICELSKQNQSKIKELVSNYLIKEDYDDDKITETISNVMSGRLWVLEEIIDIKPFLTVGKVIMMK